MSGSGYPKFRNDRGVPEICIGVKEFECIGVSPGRGSASILDCHRSMLTRRTASLLINNAA